MFRKMHHWTPRYIVNRLLLEYEQRRNPDAPWMTKKACEFLADWLKPSHVGIEWGSGRSTVWLAQRVRVLTSVEHDPTWHARVDAQLRQRAISNVKYCFAPLDTRQNELPRYVRIGARLEEESLDFALVDGMQRDICTQIAMARLKPGGLLIIDNVEQYLPHESYAPSAISRTGVTVSALWRSLTNELSQWCCFWTSNGVWDTAIFTKPIDSSMRPIPDGQATAK